MRVFKLLGICLCIGWGAFGCAVPPGQTGQNGQQPTISLPPLDEEVVGGIMEGVAELSSEFGELAKPGQVQAWVDQLIVKVQPGKDMPQVATLAEGEMAEYLYQRTVRKSEYNLRGQRYFEPWILIKTQEGVMGWVHEGGVRYVGPDLQKMLKDLGVAGNSQTRPDARTRGPAVSEVIPAENRMVIPGKQVGAIKVNTNEMDLAHIYGTNHIGRGSVVGPEGQPLEATVILPGDADEIKIVWKNTERTQIKAVYFDKINSGWYTPQGLTVGLPLMELTKVNKAPVHFYGFNWSYGGTISGWAKGKLAPYAQHFYAVLAPHPSRANGPVVKQFTGNQYYNTNKKDVEQLGAYVKRMVVYLD
ncbi:MAG: hypothetical protein AAFV07_17245 [Bacteroidota bacterium]